MRIGSVALPPVPALLLAATVSAGEPMSTYYSFDVWTNDAEVAVFVNDIPVEVFTPGQSGGGSMNFWLMNGANTIVFTFTDSGDDAQAGAGIDVSAPEGYETLAKFGWPGSDSPAAFTLEVDGLPAWTWLRAEPTPGAEADVELAVRKLHALAEAGDKKGFFAMAGALNADMVAVAGDPAIVEENNDGMWKELRAGLRPLGPLTITPVRGGQVYRVLAEDGSGPIQSEDAEGGVLSMGTWWGRIDGVWQLVK